MPFLPLPNRSKLRWQGFEPCVLTHDRIAVPLSYSAASNDRCVTVGLGRPTLQVPPPYPTLRPVPSGALVARTGQWSSKFPQRVERVHQRGRRRPKMVVFMTRLDVLLEARLRSLHQRFALLVPVELGFELCNTLVFELAYTRNNLFEYACHVLTLPQTLNCGASTLCLT